ncbi:MAG: hypothetical protein H7331_08650 [Bacteroidia bacterium]|nr:hypothetical protein [Bacteroidia bacterium]
MNKKITYFSVLAIASSTLLLSSCNNDKTDEQKSSIDSTGTINAKIGGAVFSIPSPIQTSLLLKKANAKYDKSLLNSSANLPKYTTNFKKALNLGIYGADLGYVSIFDQTQDALGYLNTVRKLADEMGVAAAFDASLIKRFEANLGKKDSLILLVSDGLRASNNFLQNNDRNDVAGLVIAGGWLESLHFTIAVAKETNNQEVINRIGEQKSTLNNLIKLLTPSYEKPEYTPFLDALIELAYDFDKVEVNYTYVAPTTDEAAKLTTVNSTTEVKINKDLIESISAKVIKIRASVTE